VATVPYGGPYADAVLPPDVVRVGPSRGASPWLDAAHLADHASEVDVLHLHSGSGPVRDAAVQCWSETVRRCGIPLVVTVHDVRAPGAHRSARSAAEDAHLEAVLATAEVVFTLTADAADAIAERFGRTAIVVAHPSLARPDPELGSERGLVGLRLRPGDHERHHQVAIVRAALSGAVSGGGRLRVLAPVGTDVDASVGELGERHELELVRYAEDEWAAQLQQLHVAVLPEACGAHSRDLEICRDVGTRVVAPGCAWAAGQWAEVVAYGEDERGQLDPVSLSAAVAVALTRPMLLPADAAWRREQLAAVRRVHAEVYAQVAGDRSWV
jgi:Glycosyltransferase Family 4